MAAHFSTLAWKIPRTEEPGRLQSMGSQGVGHNWATSLSLSHPCSSDTGYPEVKYGSPLMVFTPAWLWDGRSICFAGFSFFFFWTGLYYFISFYCFGHTTWCVDFNSLIKGSNPCPLHWKAKSQPLGHREALGFPWGTERQAGSLCHRHSGPSDGNCLGIFRGLCAPWPSHPGHKAGLPLRFSPRSVYWHGWQHRTDFCFLPRCRERERERLDLLPHLELLKCQTETYEIGQ